jgi:hypothetical protein
MEPDMATAAAAGSAVASDDEVNSRKYAPAVAVRVAVSRFRGPVQEYPDDRGTEQEARTQAGQQ